MLFIELFSFFIRVYTKRFHDLLTLLLVKRYTRFHDILAINRHT